MVLQKIDSEIGRMSFQERREIRVGSTGIVRRDRDDLEPPPSVAFFQLDDVRKLLEARWTPARPKVEQDHFALVLRDEVQDLRDANSRYLRMCQNGKEDEGDRQEQSRHHEAGVIFALPVAF